MRSVLLVFWIFSIAVSAVGVAQPADKLKRMRAINPNLPLPMTIDKKTVDANSVSAFHSQHLFLYTDIRDRSDIQELTQVFDLAIPQWCEYFDVDPSKTTDWHLRCMIMADPPRFKRAGLIPDDLPGFPAGFQRGHEMWIYPQPGNYYTRHLLIHEGTHSFMQWFIGGTGAPWYTEGMAELLGLHQWQDNKLRINFRLSDRSQAEYWGRIKLIKEDLANGKGKSLEDVFNIPSRAFRDVRSYAWSWAACEFFSNHPLSKVSFDGLKSIANLSPTEFNLNFQSKISANRSELDRDWELFIGEIDFGYEVSKGAISAAASSGKNRFKISSMKSWQRTNISVSAGDKVSIAGRGRFVVNQSDDGTPWPCEANGITIEYYRGKPLGQLVAGVLGDDGNVDSLLNELTVGTRADLDVKSDGFLCFRVNESPAKLSDNQGELEIALILRKKQ